MSVTFDRFPLAGGPYLCSQGGGGGLTHFAHRSTYYALDFECPVGTPVLAVAAGVVVEVRKSCSCSGIHVSNFFEWNEVVLECEPGCFLLGQWEEDGEDVWESDDDDSGQAPDELAEAASLFVEYVHILVFPLSLISTHPAQSSCLQRASHSGESG